MLMVAMLEIFRSFIWILTLQRKKLQVSKCYSYGYCIGITGAIKDSLCSNCILVGS